MEWEVERGEPLYPGCRSQLLEDGLGECVEAELLGGVGSRLEYGVVNPGVRDGEEEVMAEALLGPRANRKGARFPFNDSPWAERKIFVRSQGSGVAGRKPGESDPSGDQGGREPREWSKALVGVLLHIGEKSTEPWGVSLWRDVGDDIGDRACPLSRSRDLVSLL